jgi:predicted AlkP superfamily pyrophosphatase or phosphodiesterase
LTKRVLVIVGLASAVAVIAAYTLRPETGVPGDAPTIDEMAADVGRNIMTHLKRGQYPGRSGDVIAVPKPYSYMIGRWDYTSLDSQEPWVNTTHPNPWDYLTEVPIILRGPGVPEGITNDTPVDIAGLASTYADLLDVDGYEGAQPPLPGGIEDGTKAPKVILSIVIDGAGWNVLRQHPQSWPTIARLREEGTTYTAATTGSAPSTTGPLHATFGTGVYPIDHGIIGNVFRDESGEILDVYLDDADGRYLEKPTVAELWDEQNNGEPVIGTISYEGWHLGMIGHGAQREGGDRDYAALWDVDEMKWWINENFFALPSGLGETDIDALERYEESLDGRDGLEDGNWYGHELDVLREPRVRGASPAFAKLTGDAVVGMLTDEPFGEDSLTDIAWIELKAPDSAGHAWNMLRPEVGDVVAETDAQIARMLDLLDEKVGRDNYLVSVSADHGQQPLAEMFGAWRISIPEVDDDINDRFGNIVTKVTTSDVYLDHDAMGANDVTATDVARFLGAYTLGDNIPDGSPGADRVPESRLEERVYAGAFPGSYLRGHTYEEFQALGDGIYPEGKFPLAATEQ